MFPPKCLWVADRGGVHLRKALGINMGGFLGPLICSALGEKMDWHLGFGAAGIGMLAGVIQYRLSAPRLGEAGRQPDSPATAVHRNLVIAGFAAVAGIVILLVS